MLVGTVPKVDVGVAVTTALGELTVGIFMTNSLKEGFANELWNGETAPEVVMALAVVVSAGGVVVVAVNVDMVGIVFDIPPNIDVFGVLV